MNRFKLMILTICFLIVACVTNGGQPDWINGVSRQYPQSQYLIATGSAAAEEDAKRRASANLVKIFEVKVEETSRDESSAWRQTDDQKAIQGGSQLTVRYIDTYTSKLLEGASIVETWFNEEQSLNYALAVISRSQLSTKLRTDINHADRNINKRLSNVNALQEPILKSQVLYRAGQALRAREMLQKDLQIVDRTGVGVPASITSKELEVRIDAALSKAKVKEVVLQDSLGDLDRLLQTAVAAAGMQYSADQAVYALQGKLNVQDVGWQDSWYWYRGSLQLTLSDIATEKVRASMQWPLKSSGQSQQQSRIRLEEEILNLLNHKFKTEILAFGK